MDNEKNIATTSLQGERAIVTGGSRGLGLGLVEALVNQGAQITVIARDETRLTEVRSRFGVATIAGEITDADLARRVLVEVNPTILVLNAGATPRMVPLDKQSWEDFSVTWETDVKAGLYWLQAALLQPLQPGARVLVVSSGAALEGSRLSGGYAGAKRMLWIMAGYANQISVERNLGIRFQTILPLQMVGGTGVGQAGAEAYSRGSGMGPAEFLAARFGPPLEPLLFGKYIVSILTEGKYNGGFAFGLQGGAGINTLEEADA